MAIRDKRRGTVLEHHIYDHQITDKDFGKEDNEGKDAILWKNRMKDWYNAERRFVFAAPNGKMMKEFVEKISMDKVRSRIK